MCLPFFTELDSFHAGMAYQLAKSFWGFSVCLLTQRQGKALESDVLQL
jgi:hypothetical protein